MMHTIDRSIIKRLSVITLFVLVVLIFIFIILDFSNNSDDFTDKGAELYDVFTIYYLNYIPEMVRLVSPEAIFIACLILTGQMSERLEIAALKAAGVSLYRLLLPFMIFSFVVAAGISYLDSTIVPNSNEKRIAFGNKYLKHSNKSVDRNDIYRQLSENDLMLVNYFDPNRNVAYQLNLYEFRNDSLKKLITSSRMEWVDSLQHWSILKPQIYKYHSYGIETLNRDDIDTTLNLYPRDLARRSSDIFQLTYEESKNYISSLERSGAGGVNLPKVQYYGRLYYPISILVVTLIGFSIASVRRKGGKGFYVAAGLLISFFYLAFMKLAEPFGSSGVIDPNLASLSPHLFFFLVALILLISARK